MGQSTLTQCMASRITTTREDEGSEHIDSMHGEQDHHDL